MSAEFWIDIAGWAGAGAVIAAYFWVSLFQVNGSHVGYQILNLIGGILLIVNTLYKKAYPSTFVNLVWVLIAVWALLKKDR